MSFIKRVLSAIPEYRSFLAVDELNRNTVRLAAQHPGRLRVRCIGKSREGREILCLSIGDGPKNALLLGCPHPNEPIGAMTVEFLSQYLCEHPDDLAATGYTWHMIKAVDPDGTALNEPWFAGPFDLYHYAKSYYRPASRDQVEWTFPCDYKTLHWDTPLPETRALMGLIDEIRPNLLFSLHNAGFGGTFWYTSGGDEALFAALRQATLRQGVPLSLGEPEMPCMTPLGPALFRLPAVGEIYDFYAEMLPGMDPADLLTQGESSIGYANADGPTCFGLVAEIPYYEHPDVADTSPANCSRKESLLSLCDTLDGMYARLGAQFNRVKHLLIPGHPYTVSLTERVTQGQTMIGSTRAFALSTPGFDEPATRAQDFDNRVGSPFMHLLGVGLLLGAIRAALPHAKAADAYLLNETSREADDDLRRHCEEIERTIDYRAIPIRKLVSIQVESGLVAALHQDGKLNLWA